MVFKRGCVGNGEPPLFDGTLILKNEKIIRDFSLNILFTPEERHYDVITRLTGIAACDNYCQICNVGIKRLSAHKCPGKCDKCMHTDLCDKRGSLIICPKCLRDFYGKKCFCQHELNNSFKKMLVYAPR